MKIEIELTPEQIDQIAEAVAAKLGRPKENTKDALTVSEVSKRLGVSKQSIYRRIEAGIIPKIPNLGVVRIPASVIERMVMK